MLAPRRSPGIEEPAFPLLGLDGRLGHNASYRPFTLIDFVGLDATRSRNVIVVEIAERACAHHGC